MEFNKNKSRRNFLKTFSLSALASAAIPALSSFKLITDKKTSSCEATTLDYYGQGPFYTENAPDIIDNQLAEQNEPGTRLILSGVVRNLDCSQVINNATIDVWHASNDGQYDNTGYNLRGKAYSNEQGFYVIETILPGKYLNGSKYRPRHIHFKITAPGFPAITTQLYFEGDTDIPDDAAASITSGTYDATNRTIPILLNGQNQYEGTWDIIIDANSTTSINDIHTEKGIIYSVSPNPFNDNLVINFGVFEYARVSILLVDTKGSFIEILKSQNLNQQKYQRTIKIDNNLPRGIYFVVLKINELQSHYQKIIKY